MSGEKGLADTLINTKPLEVKHFGIPEAVPTEFNDSLAIPPRVEGIDAALKLDMQNSTPWYKDGQALQGYAGLASALVQLASLPNQLKLAKLQRKGLEHNLKQAETESALRATARSNLNAPVKLSFGG